MEEPIYRLQLKRLKNLVFEFQEQHPDLMVPSHEYFYLYDDVLVLEAKVLNYASLIEKGVKDVGLEGEIASLEDYLSSVFKKRIELELPKIN